MKKVYLGSIFSHKQDARQSQLCIWSLKSMFSFKTDYQTKAK